MASDGWSRCMGGGKRHFFRGGGYPICGVSFSIAAHPLDPEPMSGACKTCLRLVAKAERTPEGTEVKR